MPSFGHEDCGGEKKKEKVPTALTKDMGKSGTSQCCDL